MSETGSRHAVLVTGLSGAGRTSCLKTLEDAGFEAVDNLPLALLPALFAPSANRETGPPRIAVGVDVRTRDFAVDALVAELDRHGGRDDVAIQVVYLDCDDDVLIRRFTETRRRHPLAQDRRVIDGIRLERRMMAPIRDLADVVLDTSQTSLTDFRRLLLERLGIDGERGLTVTVTSFGFRNGIPRDADMVFDVRFLNNPHWDTDLRPLDGRDASVAEFIARDEGFAPFFANLIGLIEPLLPRYKAEGKSYLTLAVGCTGGQHRSVFVSEELAKRLKSGGHPVTLLHRDVARKASES
ncbi:MAG: RNase adapter RapZ [Rhodospirillaceae bacterium]|nr:RNase adapter RapZ [Rhodospirillaceae bacterium]